MSEKPGPSATELRSSIGGEDFRSVGVVPEEEKSQLASELGVDSDRIDDIIKTRNNSTGQLIRHGAEIVDKGNGDYALRVTDSQYENAHKAMERELKESEALKANGEGEINMVEDLGNNTQPSPEDVQRMIDSRNESMAKMNDEGAEVRMRAETDGSTKTFFAPTVEQIDSAHGEMKKELQERSAAKNMEEIEDLAKHRDEIKDEAEELAEKVENKELSTIELIALLRAEIASLRERIEELSRVADTGDLENASEEIPPTAEASEAGNEEETFEGSRDNYLGLKAGMRRWIFGRPSEQEVSEARAVFERASVDRALKRAEQIVSERYPGLTETERERMVTRQAVAEKAFLRIDQAKAESEIENRSWPRRATNWLKGHPRLRAFSGLALTGGAVVFGATGNVPGATACILGRSALAGLGAGMAFEGIADRVQTRMNHRLRPVGSEQLAQMNAAEMNDVGSAMIEYEVTRGRDLEDSGYQESVLRILGQQEQDDMRRIEELISQGVDPEMARARALTESMNVDNIYSEGALKDERGREISRALGAGAVGGIFGGAMAYIGLSNLPDVPEGGENIDKVIPDIPETDPVPGGPFPPEGGGGEEVIPPPGPESFSTTESLAAGSGEGEWHLIERGLDKFTAKFGTHLTAGQRETAIDYIKDRIIAPHAGQIPGHAEHGVYGPHSHTFTGEQFMEAINYATR